MITEWFKITVLLLKILFKKELIIMTEKEIRLLEIENRIAKLKIKPVINQRLIAKWERIKRNFLAA